MKRPNPAASLRSLLGWVAVPLLLLGGCGSIPLEPVAPQVRAGIREDETAKLLVITDALYADKAHWAIFIDGQPRAWIDARYPQVEEIPVSPGPHRLDVEWDAREMVLLVVPLPPQTTVKKATGTFACNPAERCTVVIRRVPYSARKAEDATFQIENSDDPELEAAARRLFGK